MAKGLRRYTALLLALALLTVAAGILPTQVAAAAAPVTTRSWNMGDTLSLTFYVRLERQTGGLLSYLTSNNKKGAADEPHHQGADEEDDWEEGYLPIEADKIGEKHAAQVTRTVPPKYAPRFGINKIARLPIRAWTDRARSEMKDDKTQESAIALRVSAGSGIRKETTWMPLAARRSRIVGNADFQHLIPDHILSALAAQQPSFADMLGGRVTLEESTMYITQLHFRFGFQTGAVNKLTSLDVECIYQPAEPVELELHYHWDEHRAYNPHRGITACCFGALIAGAAMTAIVWRGGGRVTRQFRRKAVLVRKREE